jgi:hypothetical protein
MRDYERIPTLIYHYEPSEPGALRIAQFFETNEELLSYWQGQLDLYPDYRADLIDYRWYGWDRAKIVKMLNTAFGQFQPFNYGLFINGTQDPLAAPWIFTESPRKAGFNSKTERHR